MAAIVTSHGAAKRSWSHAFTLVELLVVIGIVSALVGLLMPALSKAREAAVRIACLSNQRQVYLAAMNYMSDYKDALPALTGVGSTGTATYIGGNITSVDKGGRILFIDRYLSIGVVRCDSQGKPSSGGANTRPRIQNNTLMCPGSWRNTISPINFSSAGTELSWWTNADYVFPGLGIAWDGTYSFAINKGTKLLKRPKIIFSMDVAIVNPSLNSAAALTARFNRHLRSGQPDGINVIERDGSGQWYPRSALAIPAGSTVAWAYPKTREVPYSNPNPYDGARIRYNTVGISEIAVRYVNASGTETSFNIGAQDLGYTPEPYP